MQEPNKPSNKYADLSVSERLTLLESLENLPPEEMLKWGIENHGQDTAIITSFQNTGCVMIDMANRLELPLRVLTIDTLRLHPETYALMEDIENRYDLQIEHFKPDTERLRKMVEQHGEYLFFDSEAKQQFCCKIRKVEPNQRALETVDVWITGLRRDQSEARTDTPRASFSEQDGRTILKLAPLAAWNAKKTDAYINEMNIPYNSLYDQAYTSIGCIICSTPTRACEDARAGRWRWRKDAANSKECGIHIDGSGI